MNPSSSPLPAFFIAPLLPILQVILATVTASEEASQGSLGYLDPQEPMEPPAMLDERVSLVTLAHRALAAFRDLL